MSCQLFTWCLIVSVIKKTNKTKKKVWCFQFWNMKIWGFSSSLMTVNEDLSHLTLTNLQMYVNLNICSSFWWDRMLFILQDNKKEVFHFLPPTGSSAVADQKLAVLPWSKLKYFGLGDWFEDSVSMSPLWLLVMFTFYTWFVWIKIKSYCT